MAKQLKSLIISNKHHIPWNKGKTGLHKHTPETLKKMSISAKKSNNSGRFKKGSIPFMKDKHHSEISRKKMSIFRKGKQVGSDNPFYGKKHTEETRKKMSEIKGGRRRNYCDDCGKELENINARRCRKCYFKFNSGRNHHNWQGGRSLYSIDWTEDLRSSIRKRDNYICQMCNEIWKEGKRKLSVHHIDYNKENLNPNNLISLCVKCHIKTNYNRKKWINYFKKHLCLKKKI